MIRLLAIACAFAIPVLAEPWPRHTIDASSQGADGARLGDLNGDGLPDIATPWEEGGVIRVALHPGYEQAKKPWPTIEVGAVGTPEDAVFADVDNNGTLDVVSACEGDTKNIYIHWAPEEDLTDASAWRTELLPASEGLMQFMYSLPMDVNGDGRIDLITGGKNKDAAVGWFESPENPRDLTAWTWHELQPAGWIMSIEPIEVFGGSEILVSDRRGPIRGVYLLGSGDDPHAPWIRRNIGGGDREVMFLSAGEILGGLLETAVATRDGGVEIISIAAWVGNALRQMVPEIEMPPNSGTGKGTAIGDLDGDGKTEIVVTCEHSENKLGVFYYTRESEKEWVFHDIGGLEGTKFDRIELLDVDGDGDLDVITCEEHENLGVIWYENTLGTP